MSDMHIDPAAAGDDESTCAMWTAMNPGTFKPELVVPFRFYQGLEDEYNAQVAELEDYREAHKLAKEAMEQYGETIAALIVERKALEAKVAETQNLAKRLAGELLLHAQATARRDRDPQPVQVHLDFDTCGHCFIY